MEKNITCEQWLNEVEMWLCFCVAEQSSSTVLLKCCLWECRWTFNVHWRWNY